MLQNRLAPAAAAAGIFCLAGCGSFSPERMAYMLFTSEGQPPAAGRRRSELLPPGERSRLIANELFRAVVDREGAEALQQIIDSESSYLLAANKYGDTPLGTALKTQNPQAALFLTGQIRGDQLLHQNQKGEGYLYLSSAAGYKEVFDLLADKFYQSKEEWASDYEFSDLDMETKKGEKALHAAASAAIAGALEYQHYRGWMEAPFRKFQFHLSHSGQSFLHTAARDQRADVLRWGVQKNCLSRREWQEAFWSRPFVWTWEAVQSYGFRGWLDWDNLINHQDSQGRTALHISAAGLFAEGIQGLAQCVWTDYLLPDSGGNVPLHLFLRALDSAREDSSSGPRIKEAFFLLLRGQSALKSWHQDPGEAASYANSDGETSLHAAARLSDPFFYRELKQYGSADLKSQSGQTPRLLFQQTQSRIKSLNGRDSGQINSASQKGAP